MEKRTTKRLIHSLLSSISPSVSTFFFLFWVFVIFFCLFLFLFPYSHATHWHETFTSQSNASHLLLFLLYFLLLPSLLIKLHNFLMLTRKRKDGRWRLQERTEKTQRRRRQKALQRRMILQILISILYTYLYAQNQQKGMLVTNQKK